MMVVVVMMVSVMVMAVPMMKCGGGYAIGLVPPPGKGGRGNGQSHEDRQQGEQDAFLHCTISVVAPRKGAFIMDLRLGLKEIR
jgi:hypothetical protein